MVIRIENIDANYKIPSTPNDINEKLLKEEKAKLQKYVSKMYNFLHSKNIFVLPFEKNLESFSENEKLQLLEEAKKIFKKDFPVSLVSDEKQLSHIYQKIKEYYKTIYKDELKEIDDNVISQKNKIENMIRTSQKYIIALSKQNFTIENIQKLLDIASTLKSLNKEFYFAIDESVYERLNNSDVNYIYSKEQTKQLVELNDILKKCGMINNIYFSEMEKINSFDDIEQSWDLQTVLKANEKIENVAKVIKNYKLSPFETVLFIHKYATQFVYNETMSNSEGARVILGSLGNDSQNKEIVCSGYSSIVKAIIDNLNDPNLKCDFISCTLTDRRTGIPTNHSQNLIKIKDEKYGIKGAYVEDACLNAKEYIDEPTGLFSNCLYSVNDVKYIKHYFYSQKYHNIRFDNIIINREQFNDYTQKTKKPLVGNKLYDFIQRFKSTFSKNKDKSRPDYPIKIIEDFGKESVSIPYKTYKEALKTILLKENKNNKELAEKQAEDMLKRSKIYADNYFSLGAENSFCAELKREEMMSNFEIDGMYITFNF